MDILLFAHYCLLVLNRDMQLIHVPRYPRSGGDVKEGNIITKLVKHTNMFVKLTFSSWKFMF